MLLLISIVPVIYKLYIFSVLQVCLFKGISDPKNFCRIKFLDMPIAHYHKSAVTIYRDCHTLNVQAVFLASLG